ncbi:GGDEF domain-containing protein [Haliangium ochraceum]|uniref:diguanylate cyclase n=1 Tax=Haliangium ochraceum (strain DSM 14365 / JCM 11303 / SMP-2) TaxID=502025 RepID=D0LJ62_HALO1|nr:GGDEF domain-containing protein [Haliangium ochraceum]ACY14909.1 diguanylate cyclase [Haliangium ochraceum DSM 14365]
MSDNPLETTVVTPVSRISERPSTSDACLVVIYGHDLGRKYNLDRESMIIGRASSADIRLEQEAVSRNHCRLFNTGDSVLVRDLGSTNGTYINDRVVEEHGLQDGDLLKIGRCIFKFLSGQNIESAYHEEIYRLTTVDGLTQIYNKRYFMESLEREMGRAQRYRRDLSLILFDIDHFKSVNDTYGHLAGDYVLKQLAVEIKRRIRREDILARYGGEEFAIILPELDVDSAKQFGEKIRRIAEDARFFFDNTDIPVTISVGVTVLSPTVHSAAEFIKLADEKLYEAKAEGRNCVVG